MEQFTQLLEKATKEVSQDFFLLPIDGGDPIYRERVYCYELYHQIRSLWPDNSEYKLNGEVDKRNHPYFEADGGQPKPDFIVHEPGTGNNYTVIEVKSSKTVVTGYKKDIDTLEKFITLCGYERGIYLIYGLDVSEDLLEKIKLYASDKSGIEIWRHLNVGQPCQVV